jgi:hypothetical protein
MLFAVETENTVYSRLRFNELKNIVLCIERHQKSKYNKYYIQSRAINFGRQGHSLTQLKMLNCKTVVNVITYHHVV